MKVKLTHEAVNNLMGGIMQINGSNNKLPAKFNYTLQKNHALLQTELKAMEKVNKDLVGVYNDAVAVVQSKFQKLPQKEQAGNRAEFEKDLEALKEANKEKIEEWKAFTQQETEVEVHRIKSSELPDVLTGMQLQALFPIIIEE